MFGSLSVVAGAVNFLQYPCFLLVTTYAGGDMFHMNLALDLLTIPLMVWTHARLRPILNTVAAATAASAVAPSATVMDQATTE